MSDLVGNTEDRFSHNKADIFSTGMALWIKKYQHCKETAYRVTLRAYNEWSGDRGYQSITITVIVKDDGKQ